MTFVSYAQNLEDVMLWRALKHVEAGFFVDVGAAWPDEHSVTRAFYERGWRGINIEPNPELHAQLQRHRPRDTNLKLAVGDQAGTLPMTLLGDTGLSTLDESIASQHEAAGRRADRQEVEVKTLAEIWSAHVPDGQEVHFMKVDVEGLEEAALRGNHWEKNRPWVLVVEATLPMSQVESYQTWEPVLLAARYVFAYADGLNRFYVAQEHAELLQAFRYPPNVFDGFRLISEHEAHIRTKHAEARAQQAEARSMQYAQELRAVHNSASWRMTAPARWLVHQWRLVRQHGLKVRVRAAASKTLRSALNAVLSRPTLKSLAIRTAHRLGIAKRLKNRVLRMAYSQQPSDGFERGAAGTSDIHQDDLCPHARLILRRYTVAAGIEQPGGYDAAGI